VTGGEESERVIPGPVAPLLHRDLRPAMESKDDFTFAKLSDITLPVTLRMYEPGVLLAESRS
jgi:hypothetical protein